MGFFTLKNKHTPSSAQGHFFAGAWGPSWHSLGGWVGGRDYAWLGIELGLLQAEHAFSALNSLSGPSRSHSFPLASLILHLTSTYLSKLPLCI